MTETRLRTITHMAGYLTATFFIAVLAMQNLRYGFYDLFYLSTVMGLAGITGCIYTLVYRRQQLSARGHLPILAALNAGLIVGMLALEPVGISYWVLPMLLLNLLILPLRQALGLGLGLLVALGVFLYSQETPLAATVTLAGNVILLGIAALYTWHYDHMAQSAEDLAITDPVTGAHNARFLDETLHKEISRAIATGHPLSVVLTAVDYLDELEDLHGRERLQELSRQLTAHLFDVIRAGDTLYTLDKGEFFLILPFTPEEGVRVIAERVRRSISEHTWPVAGKVTVCVGCTTRVPDDTRPDSLRKRTRAALEAARKRGADSLWFSEGERQEP
jgi:diguanylate cyclase (GGDEF)-like protein